MSKTKKKLFYSAIVAVAVLLAFVAVVFMTSMTDQQNASVVAGTGENADVVSTATVSPSNDSDYNAIGLKTEMTYPGSFSGMTQQGQSISSASQLDSALKTSGTYYLTQNITYTASLGNTSAASSGTFSGVLYGNGYTVTVNVTDGSKYSWSTDGSYGFLVKNLTGTIRDLNVVIAANQSNWTKFGFNTSGSGTVSQVDGESAYMQNIGGIAGNMTGGLIHNCSVKYTGYLWLVTNGAGPGAGNAWSGDNMANIFGGIAGRASGGIISYTTVDFTGRVVNAGQQRGDGTNHLMISTGGVVGQVGNGTVYMRKITVQGGGWIASEAHTYSRGTFNYPYSDVLTGGIAGWVSSAANANLQVNGVYLNLTYFSQGADTGAYNGVTASNGNGGAVKSYYASTGGINKQAFKYAADTIENDKAGNISSDAYASEMRTSYGIGAVHQSKTNSVSLNNVYVSSATADIIQKHHPYAAHQIYYGRDTSNTYWNRWDWVYTMVDTATLGTEFAFAPTTSVGNTVNHNTADILNLTNSQRGVYFKVSNQSASRFVYNIKQGTDSVYDVYEIYSKTYNNFGNGGTLYVPVMFAGYKSNVKAEVKGYSILTDTGSSNVNTYKNSVSAEFGSYLYMDYDMTRVYDGTDKAGSSYQGSGNNYTYTYDGNKLYVPAFAGYESGYGTGTKISLTEDELNNIVGGSNSVKLSSTSTIVNASSTAYNLDNTWFAWEGAGNVGTYQMTFERSVSGDKFITKNGNHYYCSFMDAYPTKTVEVVPCSLDIEWNLENIVYDGTAKDVNATLTNLPSGNGLGNKDSAQLGIAVAYSADNPALLVQNKPYHAGDYKATATLTYGGTTESAMTGNFTLAVSEQAFTVGKVQMTVTPEDTVSYYGDDHSSLLAGAKVAVSGNWVGDDETWFVFKAKTVDDTINFTTTKGEYPTTVEASLAEGATPELLGDYNFVVTNGKLVINERPINGTLTINGGVYNGSEYVATLSLDEGVQVSTDRVYTLDYMLDGQPVSIARNAGEYVIRITPESGKYAIGTIIIKDKDELYEYGTTKLVVEQRSVDVTLSFDNGYVYDGADKVTGVAIQGQEGNAGLLKGENAELVMYYNGVEHAVMPADYMATAVFGNKNYKAGAINGGTFTVERADLADIRIDSLSADYDGTEKNIGYTLVGVAGEEDIASLAGAVTVTYNKSTSAPVNAGVYEVEISVAEGSAYNAKSVSATFTVTKAQIVFDPVRQTVYTGRNIEPEYSITAPGMDDASSLKSLVNVSHTVIFNASTYDVTLDFAGTVNYEAKQEKYQLEVTRADLAVTLEDGQVTTYNGSAQMPDYEIAALFAGDEYGDVTITVSGDKVSGDQAVNAGSYTFTLDIAQSVNYNAFSKTVNFTIDKYALELIGATEQFVTVISDDGVTEVTEINRYIPSMDVALIDDTGVYKNDSLRYVTRVNGEEASDLVFSDGKAVFTAEVTVDGLDTENYTFAGATITVNVLDASITITVNGEEKTITSITFGDELTVSAKGSYGDSQQEDVQEVTWYAKGESGDYDVTLEGAPTDAGDYMAMFRYTFGADSNFVTRALYLTVSPKAVTVTLDGSKVNITYGDDVTEESFAAATYTTNAGELSLTLAYSSTAEKYSSVGNYTLNGEVTAVADGNISNYDFTVVPGSVKVVKRTVYVKANYVSAIYGDEVILSGFDVYNDAEGAALWTDYAGATPLKVTLEVKDGILLVGEHDITVSSVDGENANYNVLATTESGKLTIEKRSIVITVNDISVVYGTQQLPSLSGSITSGTLVNGDKLSEITGEWTGSDALDSLDVNAYTLTDFVKLSAKLMSDQDGVNYDISFETSAVLNVTPKKVTVTFIGWQSDGVLGTDNVVTYNAKAWTPSGTVDGVINGDDVFVVSNDGSEIKNAGIYARQLSLDGADAGNYVADAYTANLEILPYKTEISVDQTDYVYTYGDEKTAINPTLRMLEGDSEEGSFVQKNYVGTNTGVTGTQVGWDEVWNAGSYTVVVTYSGSNYTADPVSITVTVNKKVIGKVDANNGGNLGSSVYNATNVVITADTVADLSSFTGLEDYIYVVYMLGDTQSAVVRNAGVYTIDLRLAENGNYDIEGGGDSLLNAPATYEIEKAPSSELNFSLTYANKVYDGNDMTDYIKSVIAVSGINGEPVTGASLTLTVTDESGLESVPVNSGVYVVSVTATSMANYEDMQSSYRIGNFTVDKVYVAVDAITLDDKTVTYDSTEKTLEGAGIQSSAVLKKVSYEYSDGLGAVSETGVTDAGEYNVKMTVMFDKLNSRFSDDVVLNTVTAPEFGEVYVFEFNAKLIVNKAIPEMAIDKNTLAKYFDGYAHAIEFTLSGVGADKAIAGSFDSQTGAATVVTVEGLGTFTVTYYTDAAYGNLLKDADGKAALPVTVLTSGGKTVPYYMLVEFTSSNPNYSDNVYKNSGYDMALYIMQSVVTLSFNSLSVPYGQLASQAAANEYVTDNMKYTYTVNDEGDQSVNYDPEAMLDITYNMISFNVNTGTYDIAVNAVAAKTEFAGSVVAVIRNAESIKLDITPAAVTESMKAAFTSMSDTYGNKTYTQEDFVWNVKGIMNEDIIYTVSYNGESEFSIRDAGEYTLTVSIPEGNYKAWSGNVNLSIAKVGLDVVWTMGGEALSDGKFVKTYDGQPADIAIEVLGADGVVANCVYVNSEGEEIDAPYAVGSYTAKAVLSDDNYYVNPDCETVNVVIEAIELNEDTIRGWISDDSDVYGSVQGIDITGLPEGYGATSIVYSDGNATYDSTTIKTAKAGVYSVTVTVSNSTSSGSATFNYTIEKRKIVFTASASVTMGKTPEASDVTVKADKNLASGDVASVSGIVLSSEYSDALAFGIYDMKDYFDSVTIAFNRNADCYEYTVEMGEFTVTPSKAPEIDEIRSNYNSATVKMKTSGLYAYRVGLRGTWVTLTSESDTIIVPGLKADTGYTIYVAYAGFTSVNSSKATTTTPDPNVLTQMIEDIREGGLSLDKKDEFDKILAYYETIAETDRPLIQDEYDELIAQFNALENGGDEDPEQPEKEPEVKNLAVIIVSIVCLVIIVISIAGVIVAYIVKKRKANDEFRHDDSSLV